MRHTFFGATPPKGAMGAVVSSMTPAEMASLISVIGLQAGGPFDPSSGTLNGPNGKDQYSYMLPVAPSGQINPAINALISSDPVSTVVSGNVEGDPSIPMDPGGLDTAKTVVRKVIADFAVAPVSPPRAGTAGNATRTLALRAAAVLAFEQIAAVSADKSMSWMSAYDALVGTGLNPDKTWLTLLNPAQGSTTDKSGWLVNANETYIAYQAALSLLSSKIDQGIVWTYWGVPSFVSQTEGAFAADIASVAAPALQEFAANDYQVGSSAMTLMQNKNIRALVNDYAAGSNDHIKGEITKLLESVTAAVNKLYGYDPVKEAADKAAADKAAKEAADKAAADKAAADALKAAADKAAKDAADKSAADKAEADALKAASDAAAAKAALDAKLTQEALKAAADAKAASDALAKAAADKAKTTLDLTAEPDNGDKPKASRGNLIVAGLIGLTAFGILYATLGQKKAPEEEPVPGNDKEPLVESEMT